MNAVPYVPDALGESDNLVVDVMVIELYFVFGEYVQKPYDNGVIIFDEAFKFDCASAPPDA